MHYEREAIHRMAGYTPGEQPSSGDTIKLNTNENPYPPPDGVLAALRDIPAEALRRYPSPSSADFRAMAADLHDISPAQIVTTNGGDELLRLAITTFVEPGQPIGVAEPSYSLYPVLAAVNDSPVVRVPLDESWSPPGDFAERLNQAGVPLAFLVNPHAPSGRLLGAETIARIARGFQGVLLVDEAYVDFVDPRHEHDVPALLGELDNLIVLRTMSKGYSLAGLRLGYGLGAPGVIDPIAAKTRDSYSVDAVAERLGVAALAHRQQATETWQAVRDERERLRGELAERGMTADPSEANFLLASVPSELAGGAGALYQRLRERGILVRYFQQERLQNSLRITVGTPAQNDQLLAGIDAVARHGPGGS
jgi:histidinol-phosphate aminotransferase